VKSTWLIGAAAWLVAVPAAAQPVHLHVRGDDEPERFRDALAAELERPVLLDVPGEPSLEVRVGPQLATLVYVPEGGEARVREIEVSGEPAARRETLVLVASNLLRDQTADLIAASAAAEPVPPPPAVAAPEPAPSFALTHPLHLGVTLQGGLVWFERPAPPSGLCLTVRCPTAGPVADFGGALSLSLMGQITEHVALGLRGITVGGGYSSIEGTLLSVTLEPTVELGAFVDPHVQLFGQVGFPVQIRNQTALNDQLFQSGAALRVGLRLWAVEWFSVDLEIDTRVNFTDGFHYAGYGLVAFGSVTTAGLTAGFHIAP